MDELRSRNDRKLSRTTYDFIKLNHYSSVYISIEQEFWNCIIQGANYYINISLSFS